MRVLFTLMAILVFYTSTAHAGEKFMALWPKERASHQQDMDERAAAYKERGQEYVDHLYETGGEERMPDNAKMYDLDSPVTPRNVNVDEVAKIVKDNIGDEPTTLNQ